MKRHAFTLPELLVVIMIIGVMGSLALAAISSAIELAREQRTRSIIARLDVLLGEKWESYRTRAVPIRIAPGTAPTVAARIRLYGLRDLMRMEMPERITDLVDGPAVLMPGVALSGVPSDLQRYRRSAIKRCGTNWAVTWTDQHQGAECLYLIVANMTYGDKAALDFFQPGEIGDVDGDNMPEILDGWGMPIEFLRWAPGYTVQAGAITTVDTTAPDPFDPIHADPRWGTFMPFALKPLIVSGGRDKQIDIAMKSVDSSQSAIHWATLIPPSDPYYVPLAGQFPAGTPTDFDADGLSADDITNHYQETQ